MELDKNEALQFKDKLKMLESRFLIAMDRYRNSLQGQYLEGEDTTTKSKNIENVVNKIYSDAFILTSQINSEIVQNNDNIKSLDEYLNDLKTEVDKENKTLQIVTGSRKGAVPRKEEMKINETRNYIETAVYFTSILGSLYLIYKHYSKK
jgi:hypothetical protein